MFGTDMNQIIQIIQIYFLILIPQQPSAWGSNLLAQTGTFLVGSIFGKCTFPHRSTSFHIVPHRCTSLNLWHSTVYLYQGLLLHAGVGQFRGLLADLVAEDHWHRTCIHMLQVLSHHTVWHTCPHNGTGCVTWCCLNLFQPCSNL